MNTQSVFKRWLKQDHKAFLMAEVSSRWRSSSVKWELRRDVAILSVRYFQDFLGGVFAVALEEAWMGVESSEVSSGRYGGD